MAAPQRDRTLGLGNEFSPLLQGKQWKEKKQQDLPREGENEGALPPEDSKIRQKHGSWGSS